MTGTKMFKNAFEPSALNAVFAVCAAKIAFVFSGAVFNDAIGILTSIFACGYAACLFFVAALRAIREWRKTKRGNDGKGE